MSNNGQLLQDLHRIEDLIQQFEAAADPNLRAAAADMVQVLLALHGSGIERMLAIIANTGAAGTDIMNRFGRDNLVAQLLMLHDLHPVELPTRVTDALANIQPQLNAQGADVELLAIANGCVRLRITGGSSGCGSSATKLQQLVEDAIQEAASDVGELDIINEVQDTPPQKLVALETARLS